jgi:hypothetical protein
MILLDVTTTQTNWITVIISVLSSGAISALITYRANLKMKSIDFTYDYKKYILNRRVKTYECLEPIINRFKMTYYYYPSGRLKSYYVHPFFEPTESDDDPLYTFLDLFANYYNDNMIWLSQELITNIEECQTFLGELTDKLYDLKKIKDNKAAYRTVGKEAADKLSEYGTTLRNQFFIDIKRLSDIDIFTKR